MTLRKLVPLFAVLLTWGAFALAQEGKPKDTPKKQAKPSKQKESERKGAKPKAKQADEQADAEKDPARKPARRDPTAGALTDRRLTQARQGQRGFPLPQVQLKARILAKDKPAAALIEVEGSLHLVYVGSKITLQGRGFGLTPRNQPQVRRTAGGTSVRRSSNAARGGAAAPRAGYTTYALHVLAIDANEVRIEVTGRNETITVR